MTPFYDELRTFISIMNSELLFIGKMHVMNNDPYGQRPLWIADLMNIGQPPICRTPVSIMHILTNYFLFIYHMHCSNAREVREIIATLDRADLHFLLPVSTIFIVVILVDK